jgi:hypothetical protein
VPGPARRGMSDPDCVGPRTSDVHRESVTGPGGIQLVTSMPARRAPRSESAAAGPTEPCVKDGARPGAPAGSVLSD